MEEAVTLMRNAEGILSLGSFYVKHWIISGHYDSQNINILESDCETILVMKWNLKDDYFSFKGESEFFT